MHPLGQAENIIEVEHVSFSYGTEDVLDDITLEIHRGDYLGMVGPNGSGKTTLLKLMLGLLKPSKGSIRLYGKDLRDFKDWSKIGYVPQKATSFDANFPATVREVALMGRYAARGVWRRVTAEDHAETKSALEQVGMWGFRDRLIGDLSGGQQQRVFIARALAGRPDVIFLDEPTTGVDERTQEEFYALLSKLNKELDITLVLVSHDVEKVTREAMHIACIDRSLVCHMSPEEYLKAGGAEAFHHHDRRV